MVEDVGIELLKIEAEEIKRIEEQVEKVYEHMNDKEKSNLYLVLSAHIDCLASDYECINKEMMLTCQTKEVKHRVKQLLLKVMKKSHERLTQYLENQPKNCFAEVIGYTVSKLNSILKSNDVESEKENSQDQMDTKDNENTQEGKDKADSQNNQNAQDVQEEQDKSDTQKGKDQEDTQDNKKKTNTQEEQDKVDSQKEQNKIDEQEGQIKTDSQEEQSKINEQEGQNKTDSQEE